MISNNHTFINFLRIVHTNGRFELIQLQFWREDVNLRKQPNYFSISIHFLLSIKIPGLGYFFIEEGKEFQTLIFILYRLSPTLFEYGHMKFVGGAQK